MPLSPLFKALGLRIGHYGPKFAGLYLDDPQPWQMGWPTIWPSLAGHILFGACIGFTSRRFVRGHQCMPGEAGAGACAR